MSTPAEATRPPLAPSASFNSAPTTKPPVDLHPTTHLDTSAYVQGQHAISLGPDTLVHPRARLISSHGPLIISSGTIIHSRCIVGGPAPSPNPNSPLPESDTEPDPVKTLIGSSVLLHAASTINAGASIGDFSIVEPQAVIAPGVKVGSHAKVCAGCVVERDVRDWEILWGDGWGMRRKRVEVQEYEDVRLKALGRDREGMVGLLRAAQQRALVARKKG